MARPNKTGLDYFPMDVTTDDKFELIEAKYGLIGFGVIIKLYQKIYKEGCYLDWNEEKALLFKKQVNVDINTINAIINDAIAYNIFDNAIYNEFNVLTSKGIQKRFFNACDRRKVVEIHKNLIIVDINSINANINWINDNIKYTKKSKVKESKEKNIVNDDFDFEKFWNLYDKKVAKAPCQKLWLKLFESDRTKIFQNLPNYLKTIKDKNYQANPLTYLNQRRWEDELFNQPKEISQPMYR